MQVPAATEEPRKSRRTGLKAFVFVPLGVVLLLVLAELAARALRLGDPRYAIWGLPQESFGVSTPDPDLFWRPLPGYQGMGTGNVPLRINSHGLRGPEIAPKTPGEIRILSLGESTTYGAGVLETETYSAVIERRLDDPASRPAGRRVSVVNAGVFVYSSFQSLKFLELRAPPLEPDVVLFYHEVNDYLPSTLRDSSNDEFGARMTDRQLYQSRAQLLHRVLMSHSALYRWIRYRRAEKDFRRIEGVRAENPVTRIGLPEAVRIPSRVQEPTPSGGWATRAGDDVSIGQRVSEAEREQNLRDLDRLCRERGLALVVIHPSYRDSSRHECVLTRVCAELGVATFDAFESLHPPGTAQDALFQDSWHPKVEGHRRLGEGLARFLSERILPKLAARQVASTR